MPRPEQANACPGCADSARPGYVRTTVEYNGVTLPAWKRCPKRCWSVTRATTAAPTSTEPSPQPSPPAAPTSHPASPRPAPLYRGQSAPGGNGKGRPTGKAARTAMATNPDKTQFRWPAVAVDVAEGAWALDVAEFPAPAGPKLTDFMTWLGTGLPLRVDKAHDTGMHGDGTVCLSPAALKQIGLPAQLPTTTAALDKLHAKIAKAAAVSGLEISDALGPTVRVYRRKGAPGGPKTSLELVFTPWLGDGDERQQAVTRLKATLAVDPDGSLDAPTLARRIRAIVRDLGIAPGSTAATTSINLLDAVRPRTEWSDDTDEDGKPKRVLREGALPAGDLCVPVAAGARHPLTRQAHKDGEAVCEEEDYKFWARFPTAAESARAWGVAVDVCASYMSVTETLPLPCGRLEYTGKPEWNKKVAGLWWCDFTDVEVDELLPHPATFGGMPPTGPGWYATVTVDYMATAYGFDTSTITAAYLSTYTVPFLKEWTGRLRAAYKRAYAVLGLEEDLSVDEFLAVYPLHKDLAPDDVDAWDALVLATFYKQVYKSGIGKWADSATTHLSDEEWLEKIAPAWHYRPEVRFTIIAAARIAEHRRMRKTFQLTKQAPFAVNVDSKMYALPDPDPRLILAFGDTGKPVPGTVRMGIAPGSHKHEASVPMTEIITLMEQEKHHPARLVHAYTPHGEQISA